MAFKKGHKLSGNRKGIPNRTTTATKEFIHKLFESNLDQMQDWLNRIAADDPAKAMTLMLQMAEYIIPKMSRVETLEQDTQTKFVVTIVD